MEKYITLHNNIQIPVLGFGTYQIPKKEAERVVLTALNTGYRLIDTAAFYDNEKEVGNAIRASNIPREEIFVTTKLRPLTIFSVEKGFHTSLRALGLDYIDLYLIHWPFLRTREIWKTLESFYSQNLVKAIGVSNFRIKDLENVIKTASIIPMVNQVEFHPFLYREKLLSYCASKQIIVEAHSPLTRGKRINNTQIKTIAAAYGKSPAQILIRWALQHGAIVIPKATQEALMQENLNVFDFEIGDKDMQTLNSLNENYHVANLSKVVGDDS